MGIFSKKTLGGKGLPAPEDLHFGFKPSAHETSSGHTDTAEQPRPFKTRSTASYGIDEAIKLVRALPKKHIDDAVVAGIIKQTLASVDVYLSDIIEDAGRKEGEIAEESRRIEDDIAELTAKMRALKQELVVLQGQLDETVAVRNFLRKALDQKLDESYEATRQFETDHDSKAIEGEHLSGLSAEFDIDGHAGGAEAADHDSFNGHKASADPFPNPARSTDGAVRKPRWDTASIYGISDARNKPQT